MVAHLSDAALTSAALRCTERTRYGNLSSRRVGVNQSHDANYLKSKALWLVLTTGQACRHSLAHLMRRRCLHTDLDFTGLKSRTFAETPTAMAKVAAALNNAAHTLCICRRLAGSDRVGHDVLVRALMEQYREERPGASSRTVLKASFHGLAAELKCKYQAQNFSGKAS